MIRQSVPKVNISFLIQMGRDLELKVPDPYVWARALRRGGSKGLNLGL